MNEYKVTFTFSISVTAESVEDAISTALAVYADDKPLLGYGDASRVEELPLQES